MRTVAMTAANVVPPITDPLGRHWIQPDRREILIDATHALMSRAAFDKLPEYSTSIPTGTYEGKMWKAERMERIGSWGVRGTGEWWLCWYAADADPTMLAIPRRAILIV